MTFDLNTWHTKILNKQRRHVYHEYYEFPGLLKVGVRVCSYTEKIKTHALLLDASPYVIVILQYLIFYFMYWEDKPGHS